MSPSRTSSAILMKPNRASTMPRAATSTAPSWRAIHRAKTRAARRAIVIDRFDASRAAREEFRLNGLPDSAGYELDQPYQRFGRRAGVVGVDGDRDQTRVLRRLCLWLVAAVAVLGSSGRHTVRGTGCSSRAHLSSWPQCLFEEAEQIIRGLWAPPCGQATMAGCALRGPP